MGTYLLTEQGVPAVVVLMINLEIIHQFCHSSAGCMSADIEEHTRHHGRADFFSQMTAFLRQRAAGQGVERSKATGS